MQIANPRNDQISHYSEHIFLIWTGQTYLWISKPNLFAINIASIHDSLIAEICERKVS